VPTRLLPPLSVANMFGSWLQSISNDLRHFILFGATAFCWSMWLCMNEMVVEKKIVATPLKIIYSVMHLTILRMATS
jgi:hypothetical protein